MKCLHDFIDLKLTMFLVIDGQVCMILPCSSGTGEQTVVSATIFPNPNLAVIPRAAGSGGAAAGSRRWTPGRRPGTRSPQTLSDSAPQSGLIVGRKSPSRSPEHLPVQKKNHKKTTRS